MRGMIGVLEAGEVKECGGLSLDLVCLDMVCYGQLLEGDSRACALESLYFQGTVVGHSAWKIMTKIMQHGVSTK